MSKSTQNLIRQDIRKKQSKLRSLDYQRDNIAKELEDLWSDLEDMENEQK